MSARLAAVAPLGAIAIRGGTVVDSVAAVAPTLLWGTGE